MDLIHSRHGHTTSLATVHTAGSASFLLSDVLEHIIFFAIPDSDVGHVDNSQTLRTAPTNASLVNRHWRSVALHSRRLWSAIRLRTESLPVTTRRLSQLSLFLERCGPNMDLPLDFSIFSRPNEFMEFQEKTKMYAWRALSKADIAKGISVVQGYWDLLLPRRSSWRRVNFSIWARSPMEEVEHRRPWRMDNMKTLEELYIFYPPGEAREHPQALIDFSSSELLRKVRIGGHVRIRLREGIRLEHLCSLDLGLIGKHEQHPSDVSCYSFLEQASNLQNLKVTLIRIGQFGSLSEPVTLPCLEKLSVVSLEQDSFRPMLGFLSSTICPSLKRLKIRTSVMVSPTRIAPQDAWATASLTTFIQKSACPLQILSIDSRFINYEDVSAVLRIIPTLRCLNMRHVAFPSSKFRHFLTHLLYSDEKARRGDSENLLCPDLETLVFRQCIFEGDVCKLMVAMIDVRWRAEGSKLSYFDFSGCNLDGFDDSEVIKQYRSSSRFRVPALEDSSCTATK